MTRLPKPSSEEIEEFRILYEENKGTALTHEAATEMLTAILQFYYLMGGHKVYDRKMALERQQAGTADMPKDE
jgi:hypothetical protein